MSKAVSMKLTLIVTQLEILKMHITFFVLVSVHISQLIVTSRKLIVELSI